MRVTNNMMVDQLRRNLLINQRSMYDKQDQLATGKRIRRASDDPILSSRVLKYSTDLSELGQYERNTTDALSWLEITESAVYDNVQLLQRARELSVQAANGTNSADDTKKIAEEIKGLTKQLIGNGNLTYAGRYIFSGTETNKPFFKEDGTFNVDVSQMTIDNPPITYYEVGIGTSIDISSNGLSIYGYESINTPFTQNVPTGFNTGIAARQTKLFGPFNLSQNYTTDNLDLTVAGTTYVVDESTLNGTVFTLKKEQILDAYRNAQDGLGNKLSAVSDIYYDAQDRLVIKAKAFGATPISLASGIFTSTTNLGTTTTEALVSGFPALTDAMITASPADFQNAQMVITLNGERKKITLFESPALPTDVASVIAEMNTKLSAAFGPGRLTATGASGTAIGVGSINSPNNGSAPSLTVETIKSTESTLIRDMNALVSAMSTGDKTTISQFIAKADFHINRVISLQADIGARVNRLELIINRIAENGITYTRQLSDAQDADMGQVIMQLKNAENVYKSSLSVGARVVQPSLVDFLR